MIPPRESVRDEKMEIGHEFTENAAVAKAMLLRDVISVYFDSLNALV